MADRYLKTKSLALAILSSVATVFPLALGVSNPVLAQTSLSTEATTKVALKPSANGTAAEKRELSTPESVLQESIYKNTSEEPVSQAEIRRAKASLSSRQNARRLTYAQKALNAAISQIGRGETPPGSNCQPYSRYFGKRCQAWCADFVSWAVDSVDRTKAVPWGHPSTTSSIYNWALRNKRFVRTPRLGDIFIKKGRHTGLVRSVSLRSGTFTTVEGNTKNKVKSLRRSLRGGYYFVRYVR